MSQQGGGARWIYRAWALAIGLGLYSLSAGSGQAQRQSNTHAPPEGIPQVRPSGVQTRSPSSGQNSAKEAKSPPTGNQSPVPAQSPSSTPPLASPPATEQGQSPLPSRQGGEAFPQFPLLKKLDPPASPLADLGIHLDRLVLLPDAALAAQMDAEFSQQLARLNAQIADKQERLYRLLQDWTASEAEMRQIQAQLSQLRTERDRLALEHLLLLRQLQENFTLPSPSPTAIRSP